MNPAYQSWKRSSHAKINCRECHLSDSYAEIGFEKFIIYPVRFFKTATNWYSKPINADDRDSLLPATRCKRCHNINFRFFTPTQRKGLKITPKMHKKHLRAGLQCATCHNRVAHPEAEKYEPLKSEWEKGKNFKYKNFLTMNGCRRCHSRSSNVRDPQALALLKPGKKPPMGCSVCHTKEFNLPRGHRKEGWNIYHANEAKKDFNYCFGCHDTGKLFDNKGKPWCTACHDNIKVNNFKKQAILQRNQAKSKL
jgi:Zn finger protein HypA/HybF involved in hydrogenase expression